MFDWALESDYYNLFIVSLFVYIYDRWLLGSLTILNFSFLCLSSNPQTVLVSVWALYQRLYDPQCLFLFNNLSQDWLTPFKTVLQTKPYIKLVLQYSLFSLCKNSMYKILHFFVKYSTRVSIFVSFSCSAAVCKIKVVLWGLNHKDWCSCRDQLLQNNYSQWLNQLTTHRNYRDSIIEVWRMHWSAQTHFVT